MGPILDVISRHLMGNRRRHRRLRRKYDTIVRDEGWKEVFRGRSLDVSRGGAKLKGFPCSSGVYEGQKVTLEFLLIPKDCAKVAQRAPVPGRLVRVDEREGETFLAVIFEKPLSG